MKNWKRFISVLLSAVLLGGIASGATAQEAASGWKVGFARRQIALPENSAEPIYIAGYTATNKIYGLLETAHNTQVPFVAVCALIIAALALLARLAVAILCGVFFDKNGGPRR